MSIPSKTGFLTKLGAKFATWRRRYFVLAGIKLYYAKSESDAARRRWFGEIHLSNARVEVYDDKDRAAQPSLPDRDFLFAIRPENSTRSYFIVADTEQERSEWVKLLRVHADLEPTPASTRLLKDPNSLREGYLTKLGDKVKNWKRRYFVLSDHHLIYYRNIEDKEPAGTILLLSGKIGIEQKSIVGVRHAFSITTSDGKRKYVIHAADDDDCIAWVNAVRKRSTFAAALNEDADAASSAVVEAVDAAEAEAADDDAVAADERVHDGDIDPADAELETAPPVMKRLDHRLTTAVVEGTSSVAIRKGNIKQKVSKKKRRFVMGGLDLDLTYITDRIIAMGFPSENIESMYRNSMIDVQRFLEERHPNAYRVYNLCSERAYDPSKFKGNVCRFPFDDHNCPNFEDLIPLCEDLEQWFKANSDNVSVIHCKAGKGRTGLVICVYLLYSGAWQFASEALSYYGFVRTKDQKGVTIPSQRRYVHYFERYMREGPSLLLNDQPLVLNEIFVSKACKSFDSVEIKNRGDKALSRNWGKYWKEAINCIDSERDGAFTDPDGLATEATSCCDEGYLIQLPKGDVVLHKDFKVELYASGLLGTKSRVLAFWLHTAFHQDGKVELQRSQLDKVNKEKGSSMTVQLFFGERSYMGELRQKAKAAAAAAVSSASDKRHSISQVPESQLPEPDSSFVSMGLGLESNVSELFADSTGELSPSRSTLSLSEPVVLEDPSGGSAVASNGTVRDKNAKELQLSSGEKYDKRRHNAVADAAASIPSGATSADDSEVLPLSCVESDNAFRLVSKHEPLQWWDGANAGATKQ